MLQRSAARAGPEGYSLILATSIALVALVYVLNAFGNLRLSTDAVRLLSSAISSTEGSGRVFHGQPIVDPPGYPFIAELLLTFGIASTYTIVLFNCLLLFVGVASFMLLLRHGFGFSWRVCLLFGGIVMLNWVFVKHTPLPVTDIPYFGIALLSLFVIEYARTAKDDPTAFAMFLLGFVLVVASIAMRRVGITLVPVWIVALAGRPGWFQRLIAAPRLMQIIIAVVLLTGIGVLFAWFLETVTLRDYPGIPSANEVVTTLKIRAFEVGAVILNLPRWKLPSEVGIVFLTVGAVVIVLAFLGLLRRRSLGVVEVYCLAYAAVLIAWPPVGEPRLLIPIIPFLFVYPFIGMESLGLGRWHNGLLVAWITLYTVAGIVALSYSARITFAGDEFPALYGNGYHRATYCHFLRACPVDSPLAIDSDALKVLETFQGRPSYSD